MTAVFRTLPVLSIGGTGVISVVADLVPKDVAKMVHACLAGRHEEALQWHQRLLPLTKAQIALLIEAAKADWTLVEPAILASNHQFAVRQ